MRIRALFLALPLLPACAPHSGPTGQALPSSPSAELAPVDVKPLDWKLSPGDIAKACGAAETTANDRLTALVAVPDDKRTFGDSFEALEAALADYTDATSRLGFLKDIHPDEATRKAGAECEERAGKFLVEVGARKDLYLALKGYLAHQGKTDNLDLEQKRLVELTLLDFHRNGLDLSDADRAKLVELKKRLAELSTAFEARLNESTATTTLELDKGELAGLPEGWITGHKTTPAGKFILSTAYPDYYPVMENGKVEATRRKMEVAFMGRANDNLKALDEAIRLRAAAAKLLGYATWSDYQAEPRMAKDSKTIGEFLGRLEEELKPKLAAESAKMTALKAAETGDPKAVIHSWDWRYYENQIKQKDYAVDDEAVRAYFPADRVLTGMFDVYQTLLGVDFKEIPAETWAEGVKLYEVHDHRTGRLMAKFYVDLFPRKGKYGHAAQFTLGPARAVGGSGGSPTGAGYQVPLNALVVNFQPPSGGVPSHLSVSEVETLFHEFGHVMHASLTQARYASQSGTNVALDFVEAPSQMLENWVYQPEVLAKISVDPKDTTKSLPPELTRQVIAARKYDAGVHYERQVWLALFDQQIHTCRQLPCEVKTDLVAKELWGKILGFPEDPQEHFAATFGHMMGGYDGGYYGYLWSEVFAADMFTRFQAEGVLNPKTGKAYREVILARGRTVEPGVLLEEFLGRKPNEDAFLRMIGLKSQS